MTAAIIGAALMLAPPVVLVLLVRWEGRRYRRGIMGPDLTPPEAFAACLCVMFAGALILGLVSS
ncbi:hypothetical protein ACRAJ3_11540 [Rhodococcus pyridinivorans]|uniref:hypothetical protein n=1 Tax=Rhodococcus pyridinivorans TaxID=103816 RepID=UPI003D7F5925